MQRLVFVLAVALSLLGLPARAEEEPALRRNKVLLGYSSYVFGPFGGLGGSNLIFERRTNGGWGWLVGVDASIASNSTPTGRATAYYVAVAPGIRRYFNATGASGFFVGGDLSAGYNKTNYPGTGAPALLVSSETLTLGVYSYGGYTTAYKNLIAEISFGPQARYSPRGSPGTSSSASAGLRGDIKFGVMF